MKYLVLIYDNEKQMADMPKAQLEAMLGEYRQYSEAMVAAKVMVAGDALQPTHTATTVRRRNGKVTHTDGPFAETKEALGGYYLIDVPSLDEALAWAAKCPSASVGSVEVRPIQTFG